MPRQRAAPPTLPTIILAVKLRKCSPVPPSYASHTPNIGIQKRQHKLLGVIRKDADAIDTRIDHEVEHTLHTLEVKCSIVMKRGRGNRPDAFVHFNHYYSPWTFISDLEAAVPLACFGSTQAEGNVGSTECPPRSHQNLSRPDRGRHGPSCQILRRRSESR